ncbi:MAG: nuclear transport factor 2 family protein [Peptostreptococcaceae bacterium]|nr:nuclear transport factor 2 family protein [Peptostreptococcaceae bacterium]
MKNEVMQVFERYTEALSRGDLEAVFETMSDNILWHMGGESPLSGTVMGKKALGERLGEFVKRSDGTFRVITNWAASNDCFVAASVVSLAERGDERLKNPGMDLFKIENGKIQEVWTFSEHQAAEDKFWDI